MALTGPRSLAISGLHPCSHWPLFAIAPTHEWIGKGAYQTCTWALLIVKEKKEEEDEEEGLIAAQGLYSFINTGILEEDLKYFK